MGDRSGLLQDIPAEDHDLACNKNLQPDENLSIIGISWNPAHDSFQFRVSLPELGPRTKRAIFSAIAKLFDPLGWVTPITVTAKIFMQTIWQLKLNWDDAIPSSVLDRWETIYNNLAYLNGLQIPRWTGRSSETVHYELHGFADASTVAYAAVVYVRVVSLFDEIVIRLLVAKSKVAPLKTISVPRLELSAAALLGRLLEYVRDSLGLTSIRAYCWTDSTVVLAWLQSYPSRWKTFVANRVADIQTRIPDAKWSYVSTHENPADCASRGLLGRELSSFSLWWQGPLWLRAKQLEWPSQGPSLDVTVPEETRPSTVHLAQLTDAWDLATRFSSWSKLLKVIAYVYRFVNKCRQRKSPETDLAKHSRASTADECKQALLFWIRAIQNEIFSAELSNLINGKSLSATTAIASLSPFLDENNIMCVGGRLSNAPLSFEMKHPVLLADHPVVSLIIRHTHIKTCHAGVQLTLATLRHNYWILKARNLVKRIIYQCIPCTREKAAVSKQLMGQLPLVYPLQYAHSSTAELTTPVPSLPDCHQGEESNSTRGTSRCSSVSRREPSI